MCLTIFVLVEGLEELPGVPGSCSAFVTVLGDEEAACDCAVRATSYAGTVGE